MLAAQANCQPVWAAGERGRAHFVCRRRRRRCDACQCRRAERKAAERKRESERGSHDNEKIAAKMSISQIGQPKRARELLNIRNNGSTQQAN